MMPKKEILEFSDFHPTENEFLAFWIEKVVPTFFFKLLIKKKVGTTFGIQNAKYYFDYILIFHLSTRKIESIIIFNLFGFHAHRSIPEGLQPRIASPSTLSWTTWLLLTHKCASSI